MRANKVFGSASKISTLQGCRLFSAVWPLDASSSLSVSMDSFSISLAVAPLIASSAKLTMVISAVKESYKHGTHYADSYIDRVQSDAHDSFQDPRAGL